MHNAKAVSYTHLDVYKRQRKPIDFDNDRHSEIWWEEMEKAVVRHGVPYYEDCLLYTSQVLPGRMLAGLPEIHGDEGL